MTWVKKMAERGLVEWLRCIAVKSCFHAALGRLV
jgi:hypothetical protein